MKRIFTLILIALMCLSLCSCKSKEARNVEKLIDSIGAVSLESESAIASAENAYDILSDEDKTNVGNYDTLLAARLSLNELQFERKLAGEWIWVYDGLPMTLNADGTCSGGGGVSGEWDYSITDNIVTMSNCTFDVIEKDGIIELYQTWNSFPDDVSYFPFVKADEVDSKVKQIEITLDNWQDYFEFVYTPVWETNDFGEAIDFYPRVQLMLKDEISYCYAPNITSDRVLVTCRENDATFEITWNVIEKNCQIDLKNKQFAFGEALENRLPVQHTGTTTLLNNMGDALIDLGLFAMKGHSNLDNGQCADITDYTITRAQGYIYIFEKNR